MRLTAEEEAALLTGAAAMVIRYVMDARGGKERTAALRDLVVRPLPTVAIIIQPLCRKKLDLCSASVIRADSSTVSESM